MNNATTQNERVYRGIVEHIGYDLEDNRLRADVIDKDTGQTVGRGQLYFEGKASTALADLLHVALINNLQVEMWVHIRDSHGRKNVIYTVNFSKA